MAQPAPDTASDLYPALFRSYAESAARAAAARLHTADGSTPPAEARTLGLFVLGYALQVPEAWAATCELLLELAPAVERSGGESEWPAYLACAVAESVAQGDGRGEAALRVVLGYACQRRADYAAARREFAAGAACYGALGEPVQQAHALLRLATVERWLGRSVAAAEAALAQALPLLPEGHPEWGFARWVQGWVRADYQDYAGAERSFRASLAVRRSLGDPRHIAISARDVAYTRAWQRRMDGETLALFDEAIRLFGQAGDEYELAVARLNLSLGWLLLDNGEAALEPARQAYATLRDMGDETHAGTALLNLGIAHRLLGQHGEAQACFHTNIARWRRLGHADRLVNELDELGQLYLAQQRWAEAAAALEQAAAALEQMRDQPTYAYRQRQNQEHRRAAAEGAQAMKEAGTGEP